MLFALVVMAGVLLLTMVFNNRRRPSRWDGAGSGWDGGAVGAGEPWGFGGDSGGDSGGDCGSDGSGSDGGGGGCDGGGGGGD